jgi:putative FmdB family regulatory protein
VPTYDYQCRSCGTVTELIHSILEAGPTTCEKCGGELRRVLFPAGIIFKGSGFYRNDSRAGTAGSSGGTSGEAPKSKSDSAATGSGSAGDGKAGSTSSDAGGSTSEPKGPSSEKT